MLLAAQSVFSKSRHQRATGNRTLVDQLLLILSDGRGVFSEGSTVSGNSSIFKMPRCESCCFVLQPVEVAIRKLNEMGVFCVFIILDSLSKVRDYTLVGIKY